MTSHSFPKYFLNLYCINNSETNAIILKYWQSYKTEPQRKQQTKILFAIGKSLGFLCFLLLLPTSDRRAINENICSAHFEMEQYLLTFSLPFSVSVSARSYSLLDIYYYALFRYVTHRALKISVSEVFFFSEKISECPVASVLIHVHSST